MLSNPDVPSPEEAEEAPPLPSFAAMPPPGAAFRVDRFTGKPQSGIDGSATEEHESEPLPSWLTVPPPPPPEPPRAPDEASFEAVWPVADDRSASGRAPDAVEPTTAAPTAPEVEPEPADERRTVAVLKSGVVDGMAYTLYVDGSIEAELPQGTLRFASINELREHLERTP